MRKRAEVCVCELDWLCDGVCVPDGLKLCVSEAEPVWLPDCVWLGLTVTVGVWL